MVHPMELIFSEVVPSIISPRTHSCPSVGAPLLGCSLSEPPPRKGDDYTQKNTHYVRCIYSIWGWLWWKNAQKKCNASLCNTLNTGNCLSSLSDYEMVLHGYVEPCRHSAVILMPHTTVPTADENDRWLAFGRCFASTTFSYPEFPYFLLYPRDPGSPSENGFMEPKYYAFRRWGWTPKKNHLRIWLDSYSNYRDSFFLISKTSHLSSFHIEGQESLVNSPAPHPPTRWRSVFHPTSRHGSSPEYKWVFPKNRGTPKWMVYNRKPYQNGWFGGTSIFGNAQIDSTKKTLRFFPLNPGCLIGILISWLMK